MNTKRLITVSIFALISASTAQAADVGIPRQSVSASSPVIKAPNFTWTGFYAGVQAGGFSSKADMSIVGKDKTVPLGKDLSPKLSGFEGGVYAGANIDLGDDFIFSIDTDLTLSGQKHTKTITIGASDNAAVDNLVSRSRRAAEVEVKATESTPKPAATKPAATTTTASTPAASTPAASTPAASTPAASTPAKAAAAPARSAASASSHGHSHSGGYGGHSAHHGSGNTANPHNMGVNPHGTAINPHASSPHGAQNMAGHGAQKTAENSASDLYGIEQVKKEISNLGLDQEGGIETLSHTLKQNWAGATRVRIGFAVNRFMPYVAGGIAYTQLEDTVSISFKKDGERVGPSKTLTDEKKTMIGYTLGGGVDFAMTDNVLLRAEYRYSDFGKKKFAKEKLEINYKTNDFRVGVAYKF
ncbi:outer membrane protein [Bartonella senegalensis]|uniref:outer membrane protein n=1 Tax=Bartonella senegalensis TaxID=1468418 RepID=UPI00030B38BD|nr:outer membrane protein [Bartonella senegalensis]